MIKVNHLKLSLLLSSLLLLSGCGGGGSSSTDTDKKSSSEPTSSPQESTPQQSSLAVNQAPIAKAGADQNVSLSQSVILDAKASSDEDGKVVKYAWYKGSELISEEKSLVLDALEEGTFEFTLKVTDDKNATSQDKLLVKHYGDTVVLLKTTQGDILLKMKSEIAPKAVENFVTHSDEAYYNGTAFHRVIKDFMIQGGDPTGTGIGGESIWGGYFENETSPSVLFDKPFLLAMANAGGTKTNGSQFFITTKETSFLDGKYTIFGEVIEGRESVTKIESVETDSRDKPKEEQKILEALSYFKIK